MKQLADNRLDNEILRELFSKRLPDVVKIVFITTGITDLERSAEAADEVHERNLVLAPVGSKSVDTADSSTSATITNSIYSG